MAKKEKHSAEFKLRVEEVADLLQEGVRAKDIEIHFGKRYEVLPRMVRHYLKEANKVLRIRKAIEGNDDVDKAKARAVKRRLKIYSRAWKEGDLKICLQAEDSIAKIQGIFAPVVSAVTVENKGDAPAYMKLIESMSITALSKFVKTGRIPGFKGIREEQEEGFGQEENQNNKKTIH